VCAACLEGQYADKESHHDETCTAQGTCPKGQYYTTSDGTQLQLLRSMGAEAAADLTRSIFGAQKAECVACAAGRFQNRTSHTEADCEEWRTCSAATYLDAPSDRDAGVCTACPAGKYMDDASHRSLACRAGQQGPAAAASRAPGTTDGDDTVPTESIVVVVIVAFFVVSLVVVRRFTRTSGGTAPAADGKADADVRAGQEAAYSDAGPGVYADAAHMPGAGSAKAGDAADVYTDTSGCGDAAADVYDDAAVGGETIANDVYDDAAAGGESGAAAQSLGLTPQGILAAHTIGAASRGEAVLVLNSRGPVAGDFVLRESKGSTVMSIQAGGNVLHHKVGEADGGVTVNGKPASVAGAATLAGAVQAWLSQPAGAEKDLQHALVDAIGAPAGGFDRQHTDFGTNGAVPRGETAYGDNTPYAADDVDVYDEAPALVIGKGATYAFAKADELYGVAVYPDVENAKDDLELPDMDGHDGSPASVLAAHFVGEANRSAAECFLVVDRDGVAGDFVVRKSKGCMVLSLVVAGKKMVHSRVNVAEGGVVLVNNKPASVVAVTLAEAVGAWLASPQRAAADLGGAIADINADVHSGEAYEEGSAYLGAELELEEDVYAESTDEVHTAVVGHSTYQLASARPARPARLSSGRQNFFREASNVMELDPISPRWDDTGDTGEARLPGREVSQV